MPSRGRLCAAFGTDDLVYVCVVCNRCFSEEACSVHEVRAYVGQDITKPAAYCRCDAVWHNR
jgi:hypothetical protein